MSVKQHKSICRDYYVEETSLKTFCKCFAKPISDYRDLSINTLSSNRIADCICADVISKPHSGDNLAF